MNDERMMEELRTKVGIINMGLIIITGTLHVVAFNALRNVILCSFILLLITVELVFDGILKDSKEIVIHGWLYILVLFKLIINLFKI